MKFTLINLISPSLQSNIDLFRIRNAEMPSTVSYTVLRMRKIWF